MNQLVVIILCCLGSLSLHAQEKNLIRNDIIKIDSISSLNFRDDISDLSFLKNALVGKSVVVLGEETHLDGATDDLKNRVIKYLHEKEGYNVLIVEGSVFGHNYFYEKLKNGERPDSLCARFLTKRPSYYTSSDSVLYSYIQQQLRTSTPLKYTGMDLMTYGVEADYQFYTELIKLLEPLKIIAPARDPILEKMSKLHAEIHNQPQKKTNKKKLCEFKLSVDFFIAKIDSVLLTQKAISSETAMSLSLLKRELNNYYQGLVFIVQLSRGGRSEDINSIRYFLSLKRDSLMADNVLWLMKNRYPGEKIIISCSNMHAISAYIPTVSCETSVTRSLKDTYTLGYYLKNKLNDKLYTTATVSYDGSHTKTVQDRIETYHPVTKRSEETLEFKLSKKCVYGFVAVNQLYFNNKNNNCFKMFPTYDKEYDIQWDKAYDGFFYIKTMYPHRYEKIWDIK